MTGYAPARMCQNTDLSVKICIEDSCKNKMEINVKSSWRDIMFDDEVH